jgi:hypothetical protein
VTDGGPVRSLAVLTTGRQDWGILRSTCLAIRDETDVRLDVVAGGTHLSDTHGMTIDGIREDGFEPSELAWVAGDEPATTEASTALRAVGDHLRAARPDALLLIGDRYETAAAALAATLERVPIAHLHGGEQTLGAFDDQLRHAITKLAHLHLVSSEANARRVVAMGEDPASVHVVGAPGLDNAFRSDLPDRASLAADLGLALEPPVVIVTVHPATLDADPRRRARSRRRWTPSRDVRRHVPNVDPGRGRGRRDDAGRRRGPAADRAAWRAPLLGLMRSRRDARQQLQRADRGARGGLPVVNVGDRQAAATRAQRHRRPRRSWTRSPTRPPRARRASGRASGPRRATP